MARSKEFDVRIQLPMSQTMLDRIDAVRGGTPRVEAIRDAIESDLRRREAASRRRAKKEPGDPA